MNRKTTTIAAVSVVAALLAGISSTLPLVFAQDESETNTQQEIKQKNVGSGESTNVNCAENSIDTLLSVQDCAVDLGGVVEDDFDQ